MGLEAEILAWRLRLKSQGWDLGFEDVIWALVMRFFPQGWDLRLESGIWASRLGLKLGTGPQGWDLGFGARKGVMTGIQALRQGFE